MGVVDIFKNVLEKQRLGVIKQREFDSKQMGVISILLFLIILFFPFVPSCFFRLLAGFGSEECIDVKCFDAEESRRF